MSIQMSLMSIQSSVKASWALPVWLSGLPVCR